MKRFDSERSTIALVAQRTEYLFPKERVVGSIPTWGTYDYAVVAHWSERPVVSRRVEGSIPFFRAQVLIR